MTSGYQAASPGDQEGKILPGTRSRVTSCFRPQSTALEVVANVHLDGMAAIVTGGYSGIGVETVRALASAGARVLIGGRNLEAANEGAAMNDHLGKDLVSARSLDLADLGSVREFAAVWHDEPLNILITNAGVMASPQGRTRDGFEVHFGTKSGGREPRA